MILIYLAYDKKGLLFLLCLNCYPKSTERKNYFLRTNNLVLHTKLCTETYIQYDRNVLSICKMKISPFLCLQEWTNFLTLS